MSDTVSRVLITKVDPKTRMVEATCPSGNLTCYYLMGKGIDYTPKVGEVWEAKKTSMQWFLKELYPNALDKLLPSEPEGTLQIKPDKLELQDKNGTLAKGRFINIEVSGTLSIDHKAGDPVMGFINGGTITFDYSKDLISYTSTKAGTALVFAN
jgi:hypothetical protein